MPPRGKRRTTSERSVTYHLSSASSRSAFEEGLDFHDEYDDIDAAGCHPSILGSSPVLGSSMRGPTRRSAQPIFSAGSRRSDSSHAALLNGQGTERQTVDLLNLLEIFPQTDRLLVEEVLSGCEYSFERALEILSDMQVPHEAQSCGDMGDKEMLGGICNWDALPEDIKDIVLGFLPARDVARAAATCLEFARRVKLGAVNTKTLTIPLGLTLNGIIGMVSGHPNAYTVNLARWSQTALPERDFNALLTAISTGSRSSRRNTPVESICFKGWAGLTDGNIMAICSTMQHLKEVDLTDCPGITDAALLELSKYQRAPPRDDADDDALLHTSSTPMRGLMPAFSGSSARPVGRDMMKGSLLGGSSDEEDDVAVAKEEDEGEELLFDMDATCTPSTAGQEQQLPQKPTGRPPLPSSSATSGMMASSNPAASSNWGRRGGIDNVDDDDDNDMCQAKLASLAHLGSSPSPLVSSFKSGSAHQGLTMAVASPPSSLTTPGRALGSQMQRLGLGSGAHPRLRPDVICGSAGSGGWVGAWERASSAIPGTSASATAAFSLGGSSAGGSPDVMGGMSGLMAMYAPASASSGPTPRMTMAVGRGLRSVVLAGCSQISSDGVRLLLSSPGRKACLEALDISRCHRITRHALMVPPGSCLRVLKCAGCNNLHEVIIQLPPTCPLAELHLNNCKQLSKLFLVAPNLKLLHVGGCKNMASMSLRCPQLTQLLANLCFRWSGVMSEHWVCPRLQHINLFGARHLDNASLAVILNQSPGLRQINLNGCNAVSEVDLSEGHSELSSVDVSACKGLTSVRIAGRGLEELLAKTCPRLQEVALASRNVRTLDVSHCTQLLSLQLPALLEAPLPPAAAVGPVTSPSGAGQVGPAAAGQVGLAAAAIIPKISTMYSERNLPQETVLQIRAIKAARRMLLAAKEEAAAAPPQI